MALVSGARRTDTVATVQRYIDIAPDIMTLEPSAAPLTVITSRMNKKTTGDVEFSWVESEREVAFDSINHSGGYTESETEPIVATESVFAVGQLVIAPATNEIMRVTELKGSSKLKVERGVMGTTKAALLDKAVLFVIAQAAEENSRAFEARTFNPTKITNNTQIWKTTIAESGTMGSSQNQTSPHDWVFQHREKNREHLIAIEKSALFGHKGEITGTEGKIRATGGILSYYTENNQDAGGTLTESEWESFVRSICRYGDQKTAFVSALTLSVINNFAVGRLQTIQSDNDKTYGLSIQKYVCAHGEINLVKHNLLEGATWGGYAIAVDFVNAPPAMRPLGGGPLGTRDTTLKTNRQESDRDGVKDEIITEAGFMWPQVKHGGVLTGVTG